MLARIAEIQQDYYTGILSSQYLHLERDLSMEIIAVKGKVSALTDLAHKLIAVKGIRHGKLTMTRADKKMLLNE